MPSPLAARPPLVDAAGVRAYRARLRPDSPITVGVISNPFSRTNARSRLHDRLIPRVIPQRRNAVDTRTAGDLDAALELLLLGRGVNVLGLNGGDGTLHLGINRLAALAERVERATGEHFPLPRLLFLNGGTLNIVSRATGTKGNPARTIADFVRRSAGQTYGQLDVRQLGLLRVEEQALDSRDTSHVRYGFVFGSEVVANALEMYTLFGEGYLGLLRFLSEVAGGYTLHTRLWQEHGWKLDAPRTALHLDGVTYARYLGTVAATIDLSLLKNLLTALRVPEGSPGFFAKVMLETDPGKAIATIPRLMLGRRVESVRDKPEAGLLRMVGGYTLDGEVFLDRSPRGLRRPIEVTRAPFGIEAVRAT